MYNRRNEHVTRQCGIASFFYLRGKQIEHEQDRKETGKRQERERQERQDRRDRKDRKERGETERERREKRER